MAALGDTLNIPVLQPLSVKSPEVIARLGELDADVFVVASYGKILPKALLDLPRRGCLNLHPSLLPRHRGPSPVAGAILAGDTTTGVSVMEMVLRMDAGPIIGQKPWPLQSQDTTESLTPALAQANARLLLEILPRWLDGATSPVQQDEAKATYTPILTKEMARLHWEKEAVVLEREVRAYVPWPVSFTEVDGQPLRVFHASVEQAEVVGNPGQVLGVCEEGIRVQTGAGHLILREVQSPGGRKIAGTDFARGHPWIATAGLS